MLIIRVCALECDHDGDGSAVHVMMVDVCSDRVVGTVVLDCTLKSDGRVDPEPLPCSVKPPVMVSQPLSGIVRGVFERLIAKIDRSVP